MELITMSRAAERAASGKRGIFDVDEDSALAELKLAWADGGYHGFSVHDGIWSAIRASSRPRAVGIPSLHNASRI